MSAPLQCLAQCSLQELVNGKTCCPVVLAIPATQYKYLFFLRCCKCTQKNISEKKRKKVFISSLPCHAEDIENLAEILRTSATFIM